MNEQTVQPTATQPQQRPHSVTIFVNNRPISMPNSTATGAQIKSAADIPTNFQLFGPEGDPIPDSTEVHLHEHEHFTAISGHDVS